MRKRLLAMFLALVLAMSNLGGISVAHAEEVANPKVTAVTADQESVGSEGGTVSLTVEGTLGEKVYYYVEKSGEFFGWDPMGEVSSVDKNADGTATITLELPANEWTTAEAKYRVTVDTAEPTQGEYGLVWTGSEKQITVKVAKKTQAPAEPEGGGETEVDNTVLNVKTVDKDGNPVAGVELMLEAVSEWGENVPLGTTDDAGKYSYEIEWEYDAYLLKPTEESGFSCANPAEVFIDMTMDEFVSYVSTVNGAAYTGEVVLVVEAAEVDNTVLNVKTVDKDGNPVAGVELMLEAVSEWGENVPLGTTDDTGKYSYEIEWEYDAYLLKPAEDSGFSCANPAEVFIDMTMDDFVSYVSTVNGAAYTGVVVLVVEEGETSEDPVIKSVELVDKFVSEEGGTVTVKVKGANLPDKLFYGRQYVADDGYGGTMAYTVDWTGVEAEAEGNAKEKIINVPIDSTSTYPNALAWIVKVGLSSDISDGTYKASGELAVGMPEGIAIDETIFPDEEFLRYVLENIDTNEDGYLQQEEIDEATSIDFDWGSYWVMDLTGIEYFTNLEYLNCAFVGISELDLSANVNLKYLECSYNEGLEVLDVSKNVLLEELHCYETPISKLDVTKNTKLVRLDCNNTNISKLDVTKNTKLFALNVEGTKLKSIDVRKNKELYEVYVSFTDISKLDISKNKKLGQVRFEDTNITSMDFSNNPELVAVRCANTGIKKLDFSKNPKMYEIFCFGTKVSSLNLTKMKGLHTLECHDTNISKLNVTNNPGLVGLSCGGTKITKLDVTNNPELKRLECNDTKITNLDLSNNKKLDTLNVSNTAIEELKNFDASMLPALEELYCNNAGIEALDLSSNSALYSLDCGNNAITELDLTAIEGLWFMDTISPQNVEAEVLLEEGKAVLDMKEYVSDLSKIEVAEGDAYTYDAETGIVTFDKAGEMQVAYTYDHGYSELDAMEVIVAVDVDAIPKAPKSAQAVLSGGHDDVKFSWSEAENADGYLVSYKKATDKTWSEAVDVTDTTFEKKNLTDNVTYKFKVTSYVTYKGEKLYDKEKSAYANVDTKKNIKAPSSVKVVLSGGHNEVKVSWSKVKNADGYYVYKKAEDEVTYTSIGNTTSRSWKIKKLKEGVKYTFKVVPYYTKDNKKVESYYSKTKTAYTLKKLDAPTVEKYSSKKVRVKWENISGETGYQISRSSKEDGTYIVSTYSTTSGKSKTITATKGKTYYYKVRVYKTVNGKRIYAPWSDVTTFVNE